MQLENVACDFCASKEHRKVYSAEVDSNNLTGQMSCTNVGHSEFFQLVQCHQCGLFFSSPRPSEKQLLTAYEEVIDPIYQEEIKGRSITFQRNLQHLKKYCSSGTLLDVGCATGVFLNEARARGWEEFGIEPSAWGVERARSGYHLSRVEQGGIEEIGIFKKQFDVMTMWDVLEHVPSPKKALMKAHEFLKPKGILAFSTVDFGSLYARLMGKKWPWLMKMHIYYFNRQIIKKYLAEAGFEVLSIRVYKHTVSLKYLIYKMKTLNLLGYHVLNSINCLFRNQDIFLTIALGDFMEVYAQKK
ncbi:MAG: class I SAM-dependent methyltransferase [Candidatus Omnitrophica bacterium]|nr:class I SAM-dependent methyltransferase [Candidatus Omnitrophota bacterium]